MATRSVLKRSVRTRRALPVLPVVSVFLLAGCGVAGTQFHPGLAAQVGDQTISTRHVDQVTHDACKGLETLNRGSAQPSTPTPMSTLTSQVTTALVEKLVAEQLADDYGVTPTSDYKGNVAQTAKQLTKLSSAEKDAVQEVVDAQAYMQDVMVQIGGIELEKQGQTDAGAEDKYNEGLKQLDAWVADHDVHINPKYAIEIGAEEPVDTALSVAVSKQAKNGIAANPGAAYTGSLPGSFVCFD
ncbi:SurA N-terminal domain-containing protein [Nocardioides halotolerans]|uniref:SurA N-terminal domain-containing protein n=1 Tax=Nocardioides halotolerans TaxID=433660 RepID=UPI0012F99AB4|nr:SurA N-terminal domain-containing protein [Nocardioides halotolerans]